ncbi:TPA: hypothetical protein QB352_001762 [Pasteurella multocida]|nr:hypothetical protein [Pasteurella multocida]
MTRIRFTVEFVIENHRCSIASNSFLHSIDANSAHFTAQADLQLSTPKALSTQSSHLTANKIRTEQASLNAAGAVWKQTGTDDFELKGKQLVTTGAAFSTQGNIKVEANQLDNAQGTLSSAKSFILKVAGTINSEGGQLLAGEDLRLIVDSFSNITQCNKA